MNKQQFQEREKFHKLHIGIYMQHGYPSDEQRHRDSLAALYAKHPDFVE